MRVCMECARSAAYTCHVMKALSDGGNEGTHRTVCSTLAHDLSAAGASGAFSKAEQQAPSPRTAVANGRLEQTAEVGGGEIASGTAVDVQLMEEAWLESEYPESL